MVVPGRVILPLVVCWKRRCIQASTTERCEASRTLFKAMDGKPRVWEGEKHLISRAEIWWEGTAPDAVGHTKGCLCSHNTQNPGCDARKANGGPRRVQKATTPEYPLKQRGCRTGKGRGEPRLRKKMNLFQMGSATSPNIVTVTPPKLHEGRQFDGFDIFDPP